jgi:hypothetical protein
MVRRQENVGWGGLSVGKVRSGSISTNNGRDNRQSATVFKKEQQRLRGHGARANVTRKGKRRKKQCARGKRWQNAGGAGLIMGRRAGASASDARAQAEIHRGPIQTATRARGLNRPGRRRCKRCGGKTGTIGDAAGVPAIKRDGAEGGGVASDGQRMRRQRTERRNACGSKSFESKGTALSKVGR